MYSFIQIQTTITVLQLLCACLVHKKLLLTMQASTTLLEDSTSELVTHTHTHTHAHTCVLTYSIFLLLIFSSTQAAVCARWKPYIRETSQSTEHYQTHRKRGGVSFIWLQEGLGTTHWKFVIPESQCPGSAARIGCSSVDSKPLQY